MPTTRDDPTGPIRLLVRLLRRDAGGIRRCLEQRREVLDELAAVALDGGLSVALLRALAGSGLTQQLSEERQVALAGRRDRQARQYAVLEKGLAHVASTFEAAGLPFILLKGPHLAARFYGDPQGREFVDVDLLIRRADRRRAFRILEEAGFARRSRVLGSEALTAFFVHGFDFVADGVNLDLHWSLSRHPSFRVDESRIWERKGVFLLGDRSYGVLADEDEVTLEVLALLRDIARGRPKIKNVADLGRAARERPQQRHLWAAGQCAVALPRRRRCPRPRAAPRGHPRAPCRPSRAFGSRRSTVARSAGTDGVRNQALGGPSARRRARELVCVVGRIAAVSPCRARLAAARR
jgi:hypothetical protein